jgi:hypothetical protein
MDLDNLSDQEVMLCARALSIHRVSLRRKLGRLTRGTHEHEGTMKEIKDTQELVDKLNQVDLARASVA